MCFDNNWREGKKVKVADLLSCFFQIWQRHVPLYHRLIHRVEWRPIGKAANQYTPKCVPLIHWWIKTACNEQSKMFRHITLNFKWEDKLIRLTGIYLNSVRRSPCTALSNIDWKPSVAAVPSIVTTTTDINITITCCKRISIIN